MDEPTPTATRSKSRVMATSTINGERVPSPLEEILDPAIGLGYLERRGDRHPPPEQR
ncbi:MAG: hypothetical protein M3Y09_14535 [Actinomycetota bacterium]|nr:hypothetical protein [Actinomycetota bacterium]